ncbi:hypothetical protein KY342_06220 [Candidatus Woesearchaeota archaeon]|nr:hypothetical protein [Candidatus Woesearchaeota archaeon]
MVNFEQVDKVNKLAKALKESNMATTMDEAVKMAKDMISRGEESIKELSQKQTAQDLVEERFRENPIKKITESTKDFVENLGEALHIKEKEKAKPVKTKETKELIKDAEKKGVNKLIKKTEKLKEELKTEEKDKVRKVGHEIEEIKDDIEEIEEKEFEEE